VSWSRRSFLARFVAAGASALAAFRVAERAHAQAGPEGLVVHIPSIGVSVVTESVTINVEGQLGTPVDPDRVGAYRVGGNLLLVGHVDWQKVRRPFSRLRLLNRGDPVFLSDGRAYKVDWWADWSVSDDDGSWAYASAPVVDALTLITCSGKYSVSQSAYLDRLVVRAVPEAEFVTP
jgi:sortase (surface protein transpeptidase)